MSHVSSFSVSKVDLILIQFEDPSSTVTILGQLLGKDYSKSFIICYQCYWSLCIQIVTVLLNGPYYSGSFQVGNGVIVF